MWITVLLFNVEWLWPFIKLNKYQPNQPTQPTNPTQPQGIFFLSLIMSYLHQTFRISSISSNNMIYDSKYDPHPSSLQSGTINIVQVPTFPFSAKLCPILIKLAAYPPWFKMSKLTPSFNSPVRNYQNTPSPQLHFSQSKKAWSWSNFHDRPLRNYLLHP